MMERAPCGVCGASDTYLLFRAPDQTGPVPGALFPVGRCRRCGHVYVLERPPISEIGRYYPDDYEPHREVEGKGERTDSKRHRHIRRRPPFRILDVGCGSGYDLIRFLRLKCEVYGVEPDPRAAEQARGLGITVANCGADRADFPADFFDVVTMNHILEHVHSPRAVLENVRRMTRRDGEVHLMIPTSDGLFFRVFGKDWYHLDVPRHLHFFSHEPFARLCRETGFRIVYRGYRSGPRGLRGSLTNLSTRRPSAKIVYRVIRFRPIRWFVRTLMRYGVDGLRLGDVAEYTLRPHC